MLLPSAYGRYGFYTTTHRRFNCIHSVNRLGGLRRKPSVLEDALHSH